MFIPAMPFGITPIGRPALRPALDQLDPVVVRVAHEAEE
jgi:hypothetical protein